MNYDGEKSYTGVGERNVGRAALFLAGEVFKVLSAFGPSFDMCTS
jgi:hypothetical protein